MAKEGRIPSLDPPGSSINAVFDCDRGGCSTKPTGETEF